MSTHAAGPGAGDPEEERPSAPEALADTMRELWELGGAHLRLAALEARQAATHYAMVIGAAVAAAVLGMCAWITLTVAIVLAIAQVEGGFVGAFLIVFVLNVVLGGICGWYAFSRGKAVPFSATIRQFRARASSRGQTPAAT
jgi:hypothetical protein